MVRKNRTRGIDSTASRWAARVDRGELSEAESARLSEWLSADSRHEGAFVRAQAALFPCEGANGLLPVIPPKTAFAPGPWQLWAGGAGAIAAAVVSVVYFSIASFDKSDIYQTARGEVRRVPLADGSVITLNTQSKADVSLDPAQRNIELKVGEVFFEVAHDEERPFIVNVDGYSVRAVGTSFVVRRAGDMRFQVTVHGGIVEISQAGRGAFLLDANKSVDVDLSEHENRIRDINSDQLSQDLAWREGKIALTGQTLAEAAKEFNRYNTRPIIVGPGPDMLGVVGWYSANDPASFAQAVGTSMDLDVRVLPDRIIIEGQAAGIEGAREPKP